MAGQGSFELEGKVGFLSRPKSEFCLLKTTWLCMGREERERRADQGLNSTGAVGGYLGPNTRVEIHIVSDQSITMLVDKHQAKSWYVSHAEKLKT